MTENKRLKILVLVMGMVIVASIAFLAGYTVAERQGKDNLQEAVSVIKQEYDTFKTDSERQLDLVQKQLRDKEAELEAVVESQIGEQSTAPTGHNDVGMEYPTPE